METGDSSLNESAVAEDQELMVDIDQLQAHGINVADIKKLKSAGICTVLGIQMITKKKLCSIKGLSEAKVDKIREAIVKLSGGGSVFVSALQVRNEKMFFLDFMISI